MKNDLYEERWYLMSCSLPDLNWARLRVFTSGHAEVFDCDGRTTRFASKDEAKLWLAEDEFQSLDSLDSEDEEEYGIKIAEITPPRAEDDAELQSKMFVRVRKE